METNVKLNTGSLTPAQLDALFFNLPLEVTFVDEHDVIRYYSDVKARIFGRSPDIIGKPVQDCHSPSSLPMVNRILGAFRDGTKDSADFWRNHEGKFLHIRYIAARDKSGRYMGCLETVQDVTGIRALEGERSQLDWPS